MNLCQPSVIRALMEEAGIVFRREYGQNFLIDPHVPERIADACADRPDMLILEIGPGIGCLTRELSARYESVVAVEIDTGLIPVLDKTLSDCPNTRVVCGDVMKTDLPALLAGPVPAGGIAVCANLPYYITTPILMRLLECDVPFSSITVMVQAEVAARLSAAPGTSDYGAITAVLGYYGEVKRLFTVPAGCFLPAPKVNSAVVRVDLFRDKPCRPQNEKLFFEVIRAAFGMRRKTLCNALGVLNGFSRADIAAAIEETGLPPAVRGERLSTADFCRLSDALYRRRAVQP